MNKKDKNTFYWFGNDADGLSLIDLISLCTFVLYVIFRIVQMIIILNYYENPIIMQQMSDMGSALTNTMELILTSYVLKKGVDSTVTKLGLFKSGEYGTYTQNGTNVTGVFNEPCNTGEPISPTDENTNSIL